MSPDVSTGKELWSQCFSFECDHHAPFPMSLIPLSNSSLLTIIEPGSSTAGRDFITHLCRHCTSYILSSARKTEMQKSKAPQLLRSSRDPGCQSSTQK